MIIWLNGPFGGGKTTTAALVHAQLPTSIITDPEEVGFFLRNSLGTHPSSKKDFQDYPMWRRLVAEACTELDRHTLGGPVIAPMTLLNSEFADEIFGIVRKAGGELLHIVLHSEPDVLRARIDSSMEIKDSEERSEKVRAFRRRRLAAYEHAYDTWLPDSAEVIDTTSLAPADVAARVLTFLPLA